MNQSLIFWLVVFFMVCSFFYVSYKEYKNDR